MFEEAIPSQDTQRNETLAEAAHRPLISGWMNKFVARIDGFLFDKATCRDCLSRCSITVPLLRKGTQSNNWQAPGFASLRKILRKATFFSSSFCKFRTTLKFFLPRAILVSYSPSCGEKWKEKGVFGAPCFLLSVAPTSPCRGDSTVESSDIASQTASHWFELCKKEVSLVVHQPVHDKKKKRFVAETCWQQPFNKGYILSVSRNFSDPG